MSDVDFQEENNWDSGNRFSNEEKKEKGMTNFLIRKGIVKDQKQANSILMGIAGFFFLLMIYFVWTSI